MHLLVGLFVVIIGGMAGFWFTLSKRMAVVEAQLGIRTSKVLEGAVKVFILGGAMAVFS